MSAIRSPVVAGSFYPGSAAELAGAVDYQLGVAARAVARPSIDADRIRGLIVPHAGYQYSGPIAASAYALLARLHHAPSVVVIIGPSHFEPLGGLAVARHDAWHTPLGDSQLDDDVRDSLLQAGAGHRDAAHRSEHSLEVQLPFLQRSLPDVPVLPVAVGFGSPSAGAETVVAALPDDALLLVSTDLSHYHDAATARRQDARTASAVEALEVDALQPDDACGFDALRLAMAWAGARGYRIVRLDLRNSADTAGDAWRVVGYGAFAIVGA